MHLREAGSSIDPYQTYALLAHGAQPHHKTYYAAIICVQSSIVVRPRRPNGAWVTWDPRGNGARTIAANNDDFSRDFPSDRYVSVVRRECWGIQPFVGDNFIALLL